MTNNDYKVFLTDMSRRVKYDSDYVVYEARFNKLISVVQELIIAFEGIEGPNRFYNSLIRIRVKRLKRLLEKSNYYCFEQHVDTSNNAQQSWVYDAYYVDLLLTRAFELLVMKDEVEKRRLNPR